MNSLFILRGETIMATQHNLILDYIRKYGSITSMEAFSELGITKLATRVSELIKAGYTFDKEIVKGTNRYGDNVHYSRYSNPREPEKSA